MGFQNFVERNAAFGVMNKLEKNAASLLQSDIIRAYDTTQDKPEGL